MNAEIEDYILQHIEPEPEWLSVLDRDANVQLMNPRMNSGHLQGRLLKMLVRIANPRRVLELGTFGGYSALCMAEGLTNDAEVLTLEIDDEKEEFIAAHLADSPYGNKVTSITVDALRLLPELESGSFDMIFLDSDKRDYPALYPHCKRLLRPGGLLLADNVLWDGHIIDEHYNRDRQTIALRQFNDTVVADPEVEVVILPIRDGLSMIFKKNLV